MGDFLWENREIFVSAFVGGGVAYLFAFLKFRVERKAIKEDRKREAFVQMLHACSEVLNSEDAEGTWKLYRAAEARFRLVGPSPRTLMVLHEWRKDLEAIDSGQQERTSPYESFEELAVVMQAELGA